MVTMGMRMMVSLLPTAHLTHKLMPFLHSFVRTGRRGGFLRRSQKAKPRVQAFRQLIPQPHRQVFKGYGYAQQQELHVCFEGSCADCFDNPAQFHRVSRSVFDLQFERRLRWRQILCFFLLLQSWCMVYHHVSYFLSRKVPINANYLRAQLST